MLCLDLSQSMNMESGVSRPMAGRGAPEEPDEFDYRTESFSLVNKLAKDVSKTAILENGESRLLSGQDSSDASLS